MSAAAAAAGQNGHTNTAASEFKSSNNLWSDFFGAADQVGFLKKYINYNTYICILLVFNTAHMFLKMYNIL